MVWKPTITVDEDVYNGLHAKVGPRRISRFLNDLAKRLAPAGSLRAGYRVMAADGVREDEASQWTEALIGDAACGESSVAELT